MSCRCFLSFALSGLLFCVGVDFPQSGAICPVRALWGLVGAFWFSVCACIGVVFILSGFVLSILYFLYVPPLYNIYRYKEGVFNLCFSLYFFVLARFVLGFRICILRGFAALAASPPSRCLVFILLECLLFSIIVPVFVFVKWLLPCLISIEWGGGSESKPSPRRRLCRISSHNSFCSVWGEVQKDYPSTHSKRFHSFSFSKRQWGLR